MNASVLILTLNEELNLPICLHALDGCDDVVVLDSGSRDRTRQIAEAWGARVVVREFDDFASQRNYAMEHVAFRHEWVLHLDADEVVTPAFRQEVDRRVAERRFHAYRVPSRLMFMGRWLKYSGHYPVYQVRFGSVNRLRFVQVGHGQRETLADHEVGTFDEPYLHYSFSKGLFDWFERHNRYSSQEAIRALAVRAAGSADLAGMFAVTNAVRRRRAIKDAAAFLPLRGVLRFLELYLVKRGFLDGIPGLRYCQLMSIYEQMIGVKLAEVRATPVPTDASASLPRASEAGLPRASEASGGVGRACPERAKRVEG